MGRGLASFVAGFGTGYLSTKERQKERERQEKMDKIYTDRAEREAEEYQRGKSVDAQADEISEYDYGRANKREMTNDDVRAMVGGSADANAENYVDDQSAEHYRANVTGADQVNRNASYYAKEGVSKLSRNEAAVSGGDGQIQMADKDTAYKKKPWEILEEKARTRILSGVPQQVEQGKGALAIAMSLKSEAIMSGAQQAMAEHGPEGLMKFVSNWDNRDFPFEEVRHEADGRAIKIFGTQNGKERLIDSAKLPDGMEVQDYLLSRVQGLAKPDEMFRNRLNMIAMNREDIKTDKDDKERSVRLRVLEQQANEAEKRGEVLPQKLQLELDALRANINQSKAATNSSNASTEKTRLETDAIKTHGNVKNLPASVQEAIWYQNATPEQKVAFDSLQDKNLKVTSDGVGGFAITRPDGLYRMDRKGTITKTEMPGATDQPAQKIPRDWKLVGTSNGAPVYEDSNGKRYTLPGG